MVFLYNIAPYILILAIAITGYFAKGWKRKVGTALIAVGLTVLYPQIQPSYMPKGSVKPLPVAEFKVVDKPIVDRLLKTKPGEQRDAEMQAEYEKSDARRNAFVDKLKSEKE